MAKVKSKKKSLKSKRGIFGKMWKAGKKQVEDQPDLFAVFDKGRYLVTLTGGKVKESATERKWVHLEWAFQVLEGEYEGDTIFRRTGLETEENFAFLIRDFRRFGIDTDDLEINTKEDVEEVMEQLVKLEPKVRIQVTDPNDAGFQNVYINKVLGLEAEGGNGEGDGEEELAKGDRVVVEIDGTDYAGEILRIKDDQAKIKFDDGDTDTYPLDECSKEEEGEGDGDAEDLVGETRGYRQGKKMLVGKILSVDTDDNTFVMKTDTGKKISGDIEDLEEPEGEGDGEEELAKGDRVVVEIDGTDYAGEILRIKDDQAKIKFDDGDTDTYPLDECSKEEEGEGDGDDSGDEAELNVGASVEIEYKKKKHEGKVKAINEDDEEVTVFVKKLKKKITVPLEDVTIIS